MTDKKTGFADGGEKFTEKHKKLIAAVAFAVFLLFMAAVGYFIGRPAVRFVSEPEMFREWVDTHGFWGRLCYVGMMALQVFVALIPGESFEIGGGYAFGVVEGTLLCLAGATLGSFLVFFLVRRFGSKFVEVYFPLEKINSLKFLKDSKKRDVLLFVLFALPGTPKDLLCYFAGLCDIGLLEWAVICSLGRLPSIITSTVGGSALGDKNYTAAVITFCFTAALSALGLAVYRVLCNRRRAKSAAKPEDAS